MSADTPVSKEKKLFREYFLEEYDIGIFDSSRYNECISFLIGLAHGSEGQVNVHLSMCIDALRASRAFIEVSDRCKVVLP
jgi:hypothetical protein